MKKLHHYTIGSGKSVVMIHGWAMHSAIWQDFAQQLAQRFRVTCVDLPGHGRSEKICPFTLDGIGTALAESLDDEPCCWLGWSLGASVALDMARRFPERVTALIVLAGNPCFAQPGRADDWPAMPVIELEQFARQLTENCTATLLRFLALQLQGLDTGKEKLKQLRKLALTYPAPDTETLQSGLNILKHTDLRPTLACVDKPALALLGGKDALVPAAVGPAMQQLCPSLRLRIIDQAAHSPFLSHPKETLASLSAFIDELPSA